MFYADTGTIGYQPAVTYVFGFPRSIEPGAVVLDIPVRSTIAVNDGDPEKTRQYNLQLGSLGSALEHATPEQMFTDPNSTTSPPEAISTVKALAKANALGQRIYNITQANQAQVLPLLNHDVRTIQEIKNAVAVGKEVTVHTDPVSVPGWTGAGYMIIDPDTGDGAYKISGGSNGSEFDASDLLNILSLLLTLAAFLDAEDGRPLKLITSSIRVIGMFSLFAGFFGIAYELKDDCGSSSIAISIMALNQVIGNLLIPAGVGLGLFGLMVVLMVVILMIMLTFLLVEIARMVCKRF